MLTVGARTGALAGLEVPQGRFVGTGAVGTEGFSV